MTIVDRIKVLCKKKGITLQELAEIIGVGTNSIYRWDNNKPSTDKLTAVADFFNVSIDYLLSREVIGTKTESDLEKMIDNAMSFSGKPMSENDREVIMAFLKGKFGV